MLLTIVSYVSLNRIHHGHLNSPSVKSVSDGSIKNVFFSMISEHLKVKLIAR